MKRTAFSNALSMAALLVSFSFRGSSRAYRPDISAEFSVPGSVAGNPNVTSAWWAGVQAQLHQELEITPELSTTPDWRLVGETSVNLYDVSVALAGDVNGDGYDTTRCSPSFGRL